MAKDKTPPPPVDPVAPSLPVQNPKAAKTVWKITVAADGVKDEKTAIVCEPGDEENYWQRICPATFVLDAARDYRLVAPRTVGYRPFKHWWQPRTNTVVSTTPELLLTKLKRNDRYVAVFDVVEPCDIIFQGTTPKEEVTVTASIPDINGNRSIQTPGRFTFLTGTKVTFSVPPEVIRTVPDYLSGHLTQTLTFFDWQQKDGTSLSQSPSFETTVVGSNAFKASYTRVPLPKTPSEGEVHVMTQHLLRAVEKTNTSTKGWSVLVTGQALRLFNQIEFPTRNAALQALNIAIREATEDWLKTVPAGQRDWLENKAHQKKIIDHWLATKITIVQLDECNISTPTNN